MNISIQQSQVVNSVRQLSPRNLKFRAKQMPATVNIKLLSTSVEPVRKRMKQFKCEAIHKRGFDGLISVNGITQTRKRNNLHTPMLAPDVSRYTRPLMLQLLGYLHINNIYKVSLWFVRTDVDRIWPSPLESLRASLERITFRRNLRIDPSNSFFVEFSHGTMLEEQTFTIIPDQYKVPRNHGDHMARAKCGYK